MNTAAARSTAGTERPPKRLARSWRFHCPVSLRFALAILLVCAAWLATFALRTSVNAPSFQTPFFICAIVLSSWIGGFGLGMVATALSIFLVEFTFTEPRFTLGFTLNEIPKFAVFFLTGGFISWLAGRQRRDEEALLVAREGLEEKVRARTSDLQEANGKLVAEVAERTRAERELQRLNRVWRVRSICNQAVTRSADEPELLKHVCQTLVKAGGYRLAWVGYAKGDEVVPMANAQHPAMNDVALVWTKGGCGYRLAQEVIRAGTATPFNLRLRKALPSDSQVWTDANGIKAILGLPLIPDGRVIGSLLIYADESNAFDEQEVGLLQQAANDVAQGIGLSRACAARMAAEAALKKTEWELARVARVTTMGELTASIAHEINQPLAALVTNANACLRWLAAETPNLGEARTSAQRIVREGTRAAEVIARIRSLLSKGQPVRDNMQINEVVEGVLPLVTGQLQRREAKLETELGSDLPQVEVDRVQIQQVLMNLLINALDAMNDVTNRAHTLKIRTTTRDGQVVLEVQDSGVGLSPEQMDRVFDAFYSTKSEGMGMGLSISRSIIEAHDGRLWAEPNDGPGATFKFFLPAAEGRAS